MSTNFYLAEKNHYRVAQQCRQLALDNQCEHLTVDIPTLHLGKLSNLGSRFVFQTIYGSIDAALESNLAPHIDPYSITLQAHLFPGIGKDDVIDSFYKWCEVYASDDVVIIDEYDQEIDKIKMNQMANLARVESNLTYYYQYKRPEKLGLYHDDQGYLFIPYDFT